MSRPKIDWSRTLGEDEETKAALMNPTKPYPQLGNQSKWEGYDNILQPSVLVEQIIFEYHNCFPLYRGRDLADEISEFLHLRYPIYNQLFSTTNYEYNPIWNVDGEESETITHRGTTERARNVESAADYSERAASASAAKQVSLTTNNGTESDNGTDEYTDTVTRKRGGNIGVTMTQQLIEAERKCVLSVRKKIIDDLGIFFAVGV